MQARPPLLDIPTPFLGTLEIPQVNAHLDLFLTKKGLGTWVLNIWGGSVIIYSDALTGTI